MTNDSATSSTSQRPILKRIDSLASIPYVGSTDNAGSPVNEQPNRSSATFQSGGDYVPLHERITRRVRAGIPFFSLEFFPPKTANGVANFFTRLDRFNEGSPLFVDITWHMASDPANMAKETSSSSIAAGCLDYCRVDTMLHMTCVQYSKEQTMRHLRQSQTIGIRNILALRGDLPATSDRNEMPIYQYRALDMIRWIREEFLDYFTICCSGYPLGHPESPSYQADLVYLKAKVDAGAHFVITQLFFETEAFERFVKDCRDIGITVPIIPGIMPIMGYESIRRIARISQLTIPECILNDLEPIKHDDEAVMRYGTERAITMCRRLLSNKTAPSIHLYTMNREGPCRELLQALNLWSPRPRRPLPWDPHGPNHPVRCKEDVRPIFWSGRPRSYIYRTRDWDDFPNGRWGNSSSPAFGDLHDYYMFHLNGQSKKEDLLRMYGEQLSSIDDVINVFCLFLNQEDNANGVKVSCLPWNEQEVGTQAETNLIKDQLLWANRNGILTVNSQPSVNGAPSTDALVGWGKPGGYCYQKAYLECFIAREAADCLLEFIDEFSGRVNYHMMNHDGSLDRMNGELTTPIAVTWGVFPGAEIAQPTVVDPLSFRVWKDEAFSSWIHNWAWLYAKESRSRDVIQKIHDEYVLLTLVDNDFQQPSVLFEILDRMVERCKQSTGTGTAQVQSLP